MCNMCRCTGGGCKLCGGQNSGGEKVLKEAKYSYISKKYEDTLLYFSVWNFSVVNKIIFKSFFDFDEDEELFGLLHKGKCVCM